jgi:DNA-binding response OmpR family regulator
MGANKGNVIGVLVVEDDNELRTLFGLLLESEGFKVFQADDGQVALDVLVAHQGEIQMVITDLGLPGIGGVDLIKKICAVDARVRIIGTSGFGAKNVREMVLAAGADEFFSKPFSAGEVIDKVIALAR